MIQTRTLEEWISIAYNDNSNKTRTFKEVFQTRVLSAEEIIKRLKEDKFILTSDTHNCACSGKLIELPAIQQIVRELKGE